MKLLKNILHNEKALINGRTVTREAVRGIIIDGTKLLLVYSEKNGDYKFPGGGIEHCESHDVALKREIAEEIGRQVVGNLKPFGKVIEYDLPKENDYDVFMMTSYYYWCQVSNDVGKQNLEQYEKELGFLPVWIEIDMAIECNSSLLTDPHKCKARWVKRELLVLEKIRIAL